MKSNEIASYGFTSDVEFLENRKKKKNETPVVFYNMKSVSNKTGIGRNTIYSLLRELNYLDENNIPSQNYVDEGYFQFYTLYTGYKIKGVLSVSPKGIDLIVDLYENHN